jgi:hypothetical protein
LCCRYILSSRKALFNGQASDAEKKTRAALGAAWNAIYKPHQDAGTVPNTPDFALYKAQKKPNSVSASCMPYQQQQYVECL